MNLLVRRLLHILSDGRCYSGEALGESLGVSRAAVWKKIKTLQDLGVTIESVKGAGYQIPEGLDLLTDASLQAAIASSTSVEVSIDLADVVSSTNQVLLDKLAKGADIHTCCVITEKQTAGRGRRGREWLSPYAQNIYFSLGWRFDGGALQMQGLSLAVSVVVADVIAALHGIEVQLKWPNDILFEGKKLGGILLEVSGDLSGECSVVIGVGLNVNMRSVEPSTIDQPWVSLAECVKSAHVVNRNTLAGAVIGGLTQMLQGYALSGFAPYRAKWESRCAHVGHNVLVSSPKTTLEGVMLGVTNVGEVRLNVGTGDDSEECVLSGGELSLRATL